MATGNAGWSWLMGKIYGLVARNPSSNREVVSEAQLKPGERVLDIGSGAGAALKMAAEVVGPENVFGVDPTASLASTAEKRIPGAKVAVAVAEDLPFPDDSVDVVWSIASFHHWEEPDAGLREIARVLAPGGRLLVAERLLRREGGHGLTPAEAENLSQRLATLGFDDVEVVRRKAGRREMAIIKGRLPVA